MRQYTTRQNHCGFAGGLPVGIFDSAAMTAPISISSSYMIHRYCQRLIAYEKKNIHMLDRQGIYQRFNACYGTETPYELAKKLKLNHAIVYQWQKGERPIPWPKLKTLVNEQELSWDWLIEGREPKHCPRRKGKKSETFECQGINQRFLSLFPNMSQAEIGKELGINPGTVFKWRKDISQVPWERLKDAVDIKGAAWEWLIEGR